MINALYARDNQELIGQTTDYAPKIQVTETEYWSKYYNEPDIIYEWNNGYLEVKPVSDFLTILVYKWFFKLLEYYLTEYPIAESVLLEMGFRFTLPNKTNKTQIRKPDLGVVRNDNPVPLKPNDKSYHGIFDLCIEALSDSANSEIERDTISKKAEYATAGVQEYYILYGHGSPMEFYHLNAQGVYVPIERKEGDIIQSTVLPGFQFRIKDLFRQPSPDEMINDPIYRDFVLPSYTKAIERADIAEQRAELEKQRALVAEQIALAEKSARQKAEQQANAEIARLKTLLASKRYE